MNAAILVAVLCAGLLGMIPDAIAVPKPVVGSYQLSPVGAPAGTGKVQIQVTISVNGKPVTKIVTIPKGEIKPYPRVGLCKPTDTARQCAQKIADARGAASQAKAKVYADAINKAFEKEFNSLASPPPLARRS